MKWSRVEKTIGITVAIDILTVAILGYAKPQFLTSVIVFVAMALWTFFSIFLAFTWDRVKPEQRVEVLEGAFGPSNPNDPYEIPKPPPEALQVDTQHLTEGEKPVVYVRQITTLKKKGYVGYPFSYSENRKFIWEVTTNSDSNRVNCYLMTNANFHDYEEGYEFDCIEKRTDVFAFRGEFMPIKGYSRYYVVVEAVNNAPTEVRVTVARLPGY